MLTDTHCHLHFEHFSDDVTDVIDRARSEGIGKILTLGTDYPSSLESLEIARNQSNIYVAVGIHPTEVLNSSGNDFEKIRLLAKQNNEIVAIGEIGLDLYWKEVPLKEQLPLFEKMIQIADEAGLPVVIHNRDAQREMQDFFKAHQIESLRGVMHSFAGTPDDAEFYLQRGMFISFTGVITFKNFTQLDTVRQVPLERLLLETDSPFLAPVPKRGKRNEPAFVIYIAEKLAEVHHVPFSQLIKTTHSNSNTLFDWK